MLDPPQRHSSFARQRWPLIALAALVLAALVGAGVWLAVRGGNDDVPADAVAVVGEREIPKSEFDGVMDQAERGYKIQKREFPKVGTPEYNSLKNQAILYLVQRAQFEQKAAELGVKVSEKDVDARIDQIKQQYFGGDDKRYEQRIKETGLTPASVRTDIRAQLIQERLFEKVTEDVKVTDDEIRAQYEKNKDQYGTPASREVRHILVPSRRQADRIYRQLRGGADFGALAKRFSTDPGSKDQGGRLTVARGQTVPAFDRTAFALRVGAISRPVKTPYGFHIIEALSPIKPAKVTPLKDVRAQIRQQLLQTKKNKAMTTWVEDTRKELDSDTTSQVRYAPPKTTGTTATDR